MRSIVTWLVDAFRGLVGLVVPVFGKARGSAGLGRAVRWVLHALVLIAILVGLYFLSRFLRMENYLTKHGPWVQYNWLGFLFLLFYALCWLGYWFYSLLMAEEEGPEFPDVSSAWEEALADLKREGIDVREVPLFLVLGRPEGPEEGLFQAARLQWVVKHSPARAGAPLHVWATREAVFVSCAGASLLGKHAAMLAGDTGGSGYETPTSSAEGDDLLMQTLRIGKAGGAVSEIEEFLARAREEGRNLTRAERRQVRTLMRNKDRTHQALVHKADEAARHGARFEAFCRLLVRDRWPYCPVNGILLLVPFAATDTDQDAVDTGSTCRHDLAIARRVLQVSCPTLAVVCDLETAPGFDEFLERFPDRQRLQRVGQRAPLFPLLGGGNGRSADTGKAQEEMLASLARWICGAVVPGWVYKHFGLEPPRGSPVEEVRGNGQLFLFMHQLRERQRRLGTLLSRGLVSEDGEPPLFGGCYLAATGPDAGREQAFVAGVFRRLADEENNVSWTGRALEEEAAYQRWIGLGYACLAGLALLAVLFVAYATYFGPST
jgi:hypothetical protein